MTLNRCQDKIEKKTITPIDEKLFHVLEHDYLPDNRAFGSLYAVVLDFF